ncbi:catalase family protein [Denitrobaculum tricleocarpae]|uniref:Catalase family protein n=1 Tax=Denitrobaculum tricleocarpae TaxID=2591009 RepID=A0A545U3B2_9PROT|nr:catalase family protein [Denitrobaculum tricleocarpae]TQV83903.1 catalase family protein [Denitrobaculum tricleocarpae]
MAKAPNNPFEKIADPTGEAREIRELTKLTSKLLDKRYRQKNKKVLRGVHPKSHGCLRAVFEIRQDIPEALRAGLFATPGKRYRAWVRFSNAAIKVAHDLGTSDPQAQQNGSRGLAIKVLDVGGRVLLADDGAKNQDFLMINTPAFAFVDSKQYLLLNKVLEQTGDNETAAVGALLQPILDPNSGASAAEKQRAAKTAGVIQMIQAKPVENPMEVAYFGAAPFLFGPDRIMRFAAVPWGGEAPQAVPPQAGPNYLRRAVRQRVRQREDICFDFRLQVRGKAEKNLQIEDATAIWDEAKTPFVSVARLIIPAPQDRPGSDQGKASARREAQCEKMSFTPWHCLAEHQPLGSINRLRKPVYEASSDMRRGKKKAKDKAAIKKTIRKPVRLKRARRPT